MNNLGNNWDLTMNVASLKVNQLCTKYLIAMCCKQILSLGGVVNVNAANLISQLFLGIISLQTLPKCIGYFLESGYLPFFYSRSYFIPGIWLDITSWKEPI